MRKQTKVEFTIRIVKPDEELNNCKYLDWFYYPEIKGECKSYRGIDIQDLLKDGD